MVQEHHQRNVRLGLVLAGLLLAPMTALAQPGLPQPLTDMAGDAVRGKAVAVNSDLGNCSICHHIPIAEIPDGANGDIGPPLDGVGSRLDAAELRQRIVDPKVLDADTLMPAYFSTAGLVRVQDKYAGKTILTAQQVEDLIAFLLTLKGN